MCFARVLRQWMWWALGPCLLVLALTAHPHALPPTLAQSYHPGIDVQAYWVSEKYDGVRALWTGEQLLSRQGLPLRPPAWFTAGWPRTALDGELWAGRGRFAQVQAVVASTQADDSAWRSLRYMVFDMPQQLGPFHARLPQLQHTVAAIGQPWVQAAAHWRVASHTELRAQLQRIEAQGGEGLMLRHDAAPYRGGRSDDLLKVKSFDDAEATVVAHLPGQGRYAGQTGALLVEMPNGQRFRLGSGLNAAQRRTPPAVGSTVTYRFNGYHASGLPRFARFWRVRTEGAPPVAPTAGAASTP